MARYYSKISIAGTDYTNSESVRCKTGLNDRVGSWEARFKNPAGVYKSTFTVGNDVIVYCDSSTTPTTAIFRGFIESIDFQTQEQDEILILRGGDYLSYLKDRIIQYESYNATEVSAIVKDLIDKYATEITYTNTDTTTTTLAHIVFRNKSVFDAIKELAERAGFDFYVDTNKDLHFELENSISSGIVLDNSNIISDAKFKEDRDEMFNDIWVYGGNYKIGWRQDFTADGAGSVFTLSYNPYNTYVTNAGTKQQGAIFEIASSIVSGTNYAVDFDQKKIIFVSGTSIGNSIPASGNAIIVTYDRNKAIVKNAFDSASQALYKTRTKTIIQKEINDPTQAADLATAELELRKYPSKMGGPLDIQNISSLTVGNTVIVNIPNQNINNEVFKIIDVDYTLDKTSLLKQQVISVKVGKRLRDVSDKLAQIIKDLRNLQADEVDTAEIFTRLMQFTGSLSTEANSWYVKTRNLGSSFILGHNTLGRLGSTVSGVSYLGEAGVSAWSTVVSGGTFT